MSLQQRKTSMPSGDEILPGHQQEMQVADQHFVNGNRLRAPFPAGIETALFGMGCFWGAERLFWEIDGVYSTAVGYAGGATENASYQDVCSGRTGHTEVVLVAFDPVKVSYRDLLRVFWENHDPTQGMRQGNDIGTQYRSAIYTSSDSQADAAGETRTLYAEQLERASHGAITTEIGAAPRFYYAEEYHQQYLAKNPQGYCGIAGTGVSCPIGLQTA